MSQYPVFPWIIYQSNYNENIQKKNDNIIQNNNTSIDISLDYNVISSIYSQINTDNEILFRDLSKPMGQLLNNERNETFKNNYLAKIESQKLKLQSKNKNITE